MRKMYMFAMGIRTHPKYARLCKYHNFQNDCPIVALQSFRGSWLRVVQKSQAKSQAIAVTTTTRTRTRTDMAILRQKHSFIPSPCYCWDVFWLFFRR